MHIAAWLRALGLEQYAPAFRDNNIDARVLPGLTAEDLREIGVISVGHRRLLLQAIAALREPGVELFEFFEDKGFRDKQQMMSHATFFVPIVFGLIAYCWKAILDKTFPGWIVVFAGSVAIVLSAYAVFIMREFIKHADMNYAKADRAIAKLPVSEIKSLLDDGKRVVETQKKREWRLLKVMRKHLQSDNVSTVFIAFCTGAYATLILSISTALISVLRFIAASS